ncbi:MAG TPA: ArsA-related P-loop ATPase [Candidatus Dormibacteraeota bacterium]|nr:ArsA-related P-loop ATPase [Candidatus Dormibacteraeota bacterium]
MSSSPRQPTTGLIDRLANSRVVICCGAGGVGKTTVSAAIGMAIASNWEKKVLVITIDPARRLETALGVGAIGTRPVPIPAAKLRRAGLRSRGELSAAMLDMKSEWDRMVERYASNRQVRDRILANRFYKEISGAFIGSQEYMALEALYNLNATGAYDCIVVDTPPSRDALDFLDAPDRVSDFVAARFLAWMAGPKSLGRRAYNITALPFLRIIDRLLGSALLEEVAAFVGDLQSLYGGVRERALAVYELLRDERTAFAVVTSLEPEAVAETRFLCAELRERSMSLRALIVNRELPNSLRDPSAVRAATTLTADPGVPGWLSAQLGESVPPGTPLALGEAFLTLHRLAERESSQLALVERQARMVMAMIARIPLADRDVSDLEGVAQLALSVGAAAGSVPESRRSPGLGRGPGPRGPEVEGLSHMAASPLAGHTGG